MAPSFISHVVISCERLHTTAMTLLTYFIPKMGVGISIDTFHQLLSAVPGAMGFPQPRHIPGETAHPLGYANNHETAPCGAAAMCRRPRLVLWPQLL